MSVLIKRITPNSLLTGQSKNISVAGFGFVGGVSVVVNGISIPAFFVTDTLIKFVLPFVPAGTYDITVANGDGSSWTSRQILTISDPNDGGMGDLGSAQRPIVLPPIQIRSDSTAQVNPAVNYRNLSSAATVKLDSDGENISATLKQDMSYLPTEPVKLPQTTPLGDVLDTPWGSFKNE